MLLAYSQLIEHERLERARHADDRYHMAKLTAAAFGEPGRIWEEHEEFRTSLLTPEQQTPRELLEARALDLFQRSRKWTKTVPVKVTAPTGAN